MMNCTDSTLENYLFTSAVNNDCLMDFIKIAADLIRGNKVVLLFTRKHVDFMSILAGISKEHMKNLIISYHSDISGIIQKLLELHDWTIYPDLVVLDLNSYFEVAAQVPPFERVCFCISSLLSYMRSLDKIRRGQDVNQHVVSKSVSLLNGHTDMQIQLLIDFYFYRTGAFDELDAIKTKLFYWLGSLTFFSLQ